MIRRPIVLRTTYDIAAEPNRRKFSVWNSHGHVTTQSVAIPDAEISADHLFKIVVKIVLLGMLPIFTCSLLLYRIYHLV